MDELGVFARTTPEHKVRIVSALEQHGHVVAMTGDGVNDTPALKAADIGVGMGRSGTEVSKEAATMVLTDDNFATIVKAVREGRTLFANMVHFVRFQLSTNIGALLALAAAPVLVLPDPFNPVQLLWINLIMDGPPAMALGLDPARPGIMDRGPRDPSAAILDRWQLKRVAQNGVVMAVGTLAVLAIARESQPDDVALTMAFTTFVLFQFFNAFNARAEHHSTFGPSFFANWRLWAALAAVMVLQIVAVTWPPATELFETTPLSAGQWAIAVAVASTVLIVEETRKLVVLRLALRSAS
jgi:Ca2+-transporting ATPase